MTESHDDPTVDFEGALAESQRAEREERTADIERQQQADTRMIEALTQPKD